MDSMPRFKAGYAYPVRRLVHHFNGIASQNNDGNARPPRPYLCREFRCGASPLERFLAAQGHCDGTTSLVEHRSAWGLLR